MPKPSRSTAVPKPMQATYGAVVALIDAFCRDHLDDEYRDMARAICYAIFQRSKFALERCGPLVAWLAGETRTHHTTAQIPNSSQIEEFVFCMADTSSCALPPRIL